MTRATHPMTVASRDGGGARLLELGFERRSSRLYRKDTPDILEWVHFRRHAVGAFTESYGIFDKRMKAFFDDMLGQEAPDWMEEPLPAHELSNALHHAGDLIRAAVADWRRNRSLRRPLEFFREAPGPEQAHPYQRFLAEGGAWFAGDDPAGCAEASRDCWVAGVEPLRNMLLADDLAIAREVLKGSARQSFRYRACLYAFLGDRHSAKAILDEVIADEGKPPTQDRIDYVKTWRNSGWKDTQAYVDAYCAASRRNAAAARRLGCRLGLGALDDGAASKVGELLLGEQRRTSRR